MKLLTTPKYLSDAIAPLMILNYLLGLRIVEYPRGKLRIVPNLIYLLLVLGTICMSVKEQRILLEQAQLLQLEYFLYTVMQYLYAFVTVNEIVLGCFYTKQLNACYRKITQIDNTLRELGSVCNYRNIYLFTVSTIIVCFLLVIMLSIIMTQAGSVLNISTLIWAIVMNGYTISLSFAVLFEFSMFVKCLQTRFKLVNELLSQDVVRKPTEKIKLGTFATEDYSKLMNGSLQYQNILFTNMLSQMIRPLQSRIQTSVWRNCNLLKSRTESCLPSQLEKQFQMELQSQFKNQSRYPHSIRKSIVIANCNLKRKQLLQTMRQVHLELCRVSKTLCTSFGIQITTEIGISFMMTTVTVYTMYIYLVQIHHRSLGINSTDEVLVMIGSTIFYILKMVFLNHICNKATNEVKKTNEIIHSIYGYYADVDIREEIQQFGLQILQNSMDLNTFGISLNYNFLSSVLKTVTIYVVIMIQMDDSLKSIKDTQESRTN